MSPSSPAHLRVFVCGITEVLQYVHVFCVKGELEGEREENRCVGGGAGKMGGGRYPGFKV